MAYTSESGNPPLVFVLSEKTCKLFLFPFVNEKTEDVVKCLLLPDIPVWIKNDSGVSLNKRLLQILLLLSCRKTSKRCNIRTLVPPPKKSLVRERIQTVDELMVEQNRQLQQEIQEKDQEMQEMRKELREPEKKSE